MLLALNRNIPYHHWRWWQKLSGPLFLIVILHWLSFESPITLASPAGIWLALLCTADVIGALYKLVMYPFVASGGEYKVVSVSHGNKAVHLELKPAHRGFPFNAGQFGFLTMKEAGLREPHPYHCQCTLQYWTYSFCDSCARRLYEQVKVGMLADIHAPHGHFKRVLGAEHEIWIGAGVGISPFISWLHDETIGHFDHATLVYCFDPSRAFPRVERMQEMADQSGVRLIPSPTGSDALVKTVRQAVAEIDSKHIQISFCGPTGLLKRVKELTKENNIPEKNIHYELFEFR